MKLTVIREDTTVYVDGRSYTELNMDAVPTDVHALQWRDSDGWIEFVETPDGYKPVNQAIDQLPQWALDLVVSWQAADATAQAKAKTAAEQPVGTGVQTL
jgi:hypothetical protein